MKSVCASGSAPHFCWLAPMPCPNHAAARQRVQAVGRLPARRVVVGERVDERRDARHPLLVGGGQEERQHADHRDAEREEPGGRADDPEHPEQDREQHQRGAEVAAEDDQAGGEQQAGHHRDHDLVGAGEPPVLVGVDVGGPQDQGELGDLGGLDHDRAEGEPVGVAVALDAEERRQQQQRQRDRVAGVGEPADPAQRQPARDPGARDADDHPEQLLLDDRVGVVVDAVRVHARGAEHHDQADGQQQRRGAEQQVVRRQRAGPARARRAAVQANSPRGAAAVSVVAGRLGVVMATSPASRRGLRSGSAMCRRTAAANASPRSP